MKISWSVRSIFLRSHEEFKINKNRDFFDSSGLSFPPLLVQLNRFGLLRSMRWKFQSPYYHFRRTTLTLAQPLFKLDIPSSSSYSERSQLGRFCSRNCSRSSSAMSGTSPAAQPPEKLVRHGDKEFMELKEGLASILYPPSEEAASKSAKKDSNTGNEVQSVFYNPIQQFNRDLSALAIRAHGEHVLAEKKVKAEKRRQRADGIAKSKKRKREESDVDGPKEEAEESNNKKEESNKEDPGHEENENGCTGKLSVPSFTILDALSATGLRALRYASEIPFTTSVVANDLSPSAIESMKMNIEYNNLGNKVHPNIGDARAYMYSSSNAPQKPGNNGGHVGKFDAIDLDPYGTAAPFMDASVQAVKDGGLLCVTCTDAGVFASNGYPEKSFALYGGIPVKGTHSHEVGLRLILHALSVSAAKYGLAIEPVLSLSIDFYARVFVRVHRSQAEAKFIAGNTILIYNCDQGCGSWSTQPLTQTRQRIDKKGKPFYAFSFAQGPVTGPYCEHCGFRTHVGGPMWGGPLHNPHFIQKILDMLPGADRNTYQTVDRIEGMLTTALEEDLDLAASNKDPSTSTSTSTTTAERADATTGEKATTTKSPEYSAIIPRIDPALREPHPFYFSINALSGVLHARTMQTDAFRGALRHLGYRSTRSHTKPSTIRTDAPWDVIWEIMREWIRQKAPIKEDALSPSSAGAAIMQKSRQNLWRRNDEDQRLSLLKSEVMAAVESGKDVSDLALKIEAALYRSGPRQQQQQQQPNETTHHNDVESNNKVEPQEPNNAAGRNEDSTGPPSSGGKSKPHPSTLDIVFDEALGKDVSSANRKKRLVRYQMNPRANWGPLSRASGNANK